MRINTLQLDNFRNYPQLALSFTNNINIFIGNNAQGKTNIIEALYICAMGRSYRTSVEQEVIRWQQPSGSIKAAFSRMGVENNVSFRFLANSGKRRNKEIIYNDYEIKVRDLIGSLNMVLFSPEDLSLIKGMPAFRRQFLDVEISQANPAYYRQLLQYNRILLQRNHLLKKIREDRLAYDLLAEWDEQLAAGAAAITLKRKEAVKKLAMLANLMHRKITANSETLAVQYQISGVGENEYLPPDVQLKGWYVEQLANLRQQDIYRGSTGIGPHRDDLQFMINGINIRSFGSQGQQRTAVLSLKLAELEFIKSENGEYPILLLDDVMSELDAARREHLLMFIKDKIQTFITATDKSYFPDYKLGKYYYVHGAVVTE